MISMLALLLLGQMLLATVHAESTDNNGRAWRAAAGRSTEATRLLAYDADSHSKLLVDSAGLAVLLDVVGNDTCVAPVSAVGR